MHLSILAVLKKGGGKGLRREIFKKNAGSERNLAPEVLVEGTGYHAALEEDRDPLRVALGDLEVEVVPPVLELGSL